MGRARFQPYCWPIADGPPVRAVLPGDGAVFPPPQSCSEPQADPTSETHQHLGRFAESEIAWPTPHIRRQLLHCRFPADAFPRRVISLMTTQRTPSMPTSRALPEATGNLCPTSNCYHAKTPVPNPEREFPLTVLTLAILAHPYSLPAILYSLTFLLPSRQLQSPIQYP